MSKSFFIYIMLTLSCVGISFAQSLEKHLWKERLVLVMTNNKKSDIYKKQIAALKGNIQGLEERRIIVYKITPDKYQKGIQNNLWINSEIILHEKKPG